MRNLILICALLMSGCATESYLYAQAGVGKSDGVFGNDGYWIDGNETGARLAVGHRHRWSENVWGDLNFVHHSQYEAGAPFNDEPETTMEHFFYNLEWRYQP